MALWRCGGHKAIMPQRHNANQTMEKIIILDFGSQYTQLIARRIRELNIYSEILPYNKIPRLDKSVKAVILSGSPFSVTEEKALQVNLKKIIGKKPVLGICYGAQYIAHNLGGKVQRSEKREYGKAKLGTITKDPFLKGIKKGSQVWMSHGDTIMEIPDGFKVLAGTGSIPVAAFKAEEGKYKEPVYCLQFHPEVTHSIDGKKLLKNFLVNIAGCTPNWTPAAFADQTIQSLKKQLKKDHVLMGLSGGVDSTVGAELLNRAIGKRLVCIFVDNGLLRKNEFEEVLESYKGMGLNVIGVDARKKFWSALKGVSDPEKKRKIIGRVFIRVFEAEAKKLKGIKWLGQGTIYPDVIESVSVHGPCLLYTSPSPRDQRGSRMPSSA